MQKPSLDPDVADTAPSDSALTAYDEQHLVTYLRLLDADAEGADWREVTRVVLHLDPEQESDRARRGVRKPFVACQWMTEHGYRHLLRRGLKAVLMRNPGLACLSGRKCLSVEVHFASLGGVQRHV